MHNTTKLKHWFSAGCHDSFKHLHHQYWQGGKINLQKESEVNLIY